MGGALWPTIEAGFRPSLMGAVPSEWGWVARIPGVARSRLRRIADSGAGLFRAFGVGNEMPTGIPRVRCAATWALLWNAFGVDG